MNALNVIRKPVVTEKASLLEVKNVYAFWVNPKATKIDIKNAFKSLYGAEVSQVRLVKASPKVRQLRKGSYNKRLETLKAYISLKGGKKLDLNKFEKAEKESKTPLLGSVKKSPAKKTAKAKTAVKKTK